MKLNTRNLLIILGVLGVVYAITQLTRGSSRSSSLKSDLVEIDTAAVTKVIINSPGEEVQLSRTERDWSVQVGTGSRPTREGVVATILSTLNGLEPSRLASRKKENWKDYQVDSTGTDVKIYAGDDLLANVIIGRMGFENQRSFYSFVRLAEEDEVYAINDFMGGSISKNSAGFRNNTILRLEKDSLTSVRFDYPDSSFALMKNGKWYLETQEADSASVEKFLSGLRITTSNKFYDEDISGVASHRVTFSFSNAPELTVEAFADLDGFVLRSSANKPEAFKDSNLDTKLLKGRGEFVKLK